MKEESIEQLITQELQELPVFVREGILSVDWLGALQKVTQRRHLHIDKLDKVQKEVILIILGLIDSVEFIGKLSEILEIKGEELDELIQEINAEVLLPVREAVIQEKEKVGVEPEVNTDQTTGGAPQEPAPAEPKSSGLNAFSKQLTQKVSTAQKKTDYSVNRSKKVDPYHEPID